MELYTWSLELGTLEVIIDFESILGSFLHDLSLPMPTFHHTNHGNDSTPIRSQLISRAEPKIKLSMEVRSVFQLGGGAGSLILPIVDR